MAENNVNIGFQAIDEGLSKRIDDVKKRLDTLSKSQDKHNKEVQEYEAARKKATAADEKAIRSQQQMGAAWTELNSKVQLFRQGLELVKKGYEFAREGAELDFQRVKFERLAASIGTTADALLVELADATRGTMSDMELMATATDLVSLGLVNTAQDAVRLSRIVAGLGADMNQVVLALSNQTTMRFDQIGIAVVGFDDKLKELEAQGYSTNEAFTEAFLQQGEEQLLKVGEAADNTAGAFMRMEASLANLENEWQMMIANSKFVGRELENLTSIFKILREDYIGDWQWFTGGDIFRVRVIPDIDSATQSYGAMARSVKEVAEKTAEAKEETLDLTDTFKGMMGTVGRLQSAHETYIDTVAEHEAKIADLIEKQSEIPKSSKKWQEYQDAIDASNQAIADAAAASEQASKQIIFDLVQMRAAADGVISPDEFAGLLTLGQQMELIAPSVVEQLFTITAEADKVGASIGSLSQASFPEMEGAVGEVAAEVRDSMAEVGDAIVDPRQYIEGTSDSILLIGTSSTQAAGVYGQNMEEVQTATKDANAEMANMVSKIDYFKKTSGSVFTYTFHGIMTGSWPSNVNPSTTPPATTGGTTTGGRGPKRSQHGADFIVPPGYPNDTFPMLVTSGERVTVQTAAQQAEGNRKGSIVNIYAPVTMMITKETAEILDVR